MKYAAQLNEDGTTTIVGADRKPLGDADVDRRMLHILPKFFAPTSALRHIKQNGIELAVTSSIGDVSPAGGVVVRQPYPNQRYFVGGSATMRNGWVIALPDGVNNLDIELEWKMPKVHAWIGDEDWTIAHRISIELRDGDQRFYTMDANCWPGRDNRSAVSLAGHDEDSDFSLEHRAITRSEWIYTDDEWVVGRRIDERLSIPPIAYEKAWSLHAHEEEQLHEVTQSSQFTAASTEKHQANAVRDMPASVLVEAIRLAREVPFGKGSDFHEAHIGQSGACEQHPAQQLLAAWWAKHRPEGQPYAPGFAMPWVRVRDDGEYWCGYYEVPNVDVDGWGCETSTARVGDSVLLLFHASWTHHNVGEHFVEVLLADGATYCEVGVSRAEVEAGDYDEAWYALNALSSFPSRFPVAYEGLLSAR